MKGVSFRGKRKRRYCVCVTCGPFPSLAHAQGNGSAQVVFLSFFLACVGACAVLQRGTALWLSCKAKERLESAEYGVFLFLNIKTAGVLQGAGKPEGSTSSTLRINKL